MHPSVPHLVAALVLLFNVSNAWAGELDVLASGVEQSFTFTAEQVYDIRDYGAAVDGKTLCTAAIQQAIDQCAAQGGGTVYFPAGDWVSGTIVLRSHVTLKLEAGCRLLGSTNVDDYPQWSPKIRSYSDNYSQRSLIRGEDLDHVAIIGRGTIDGQGTKFPEPVNWPQEEEMKKRPYMIRLMNCRDVLVDGITLRGSVMWMQHYLACERVRIHGVTVSNFGCHCNDSLDIDGCRDFVVSDCNFASGDDALCLKSTSGRPCENVMIANCRLRSHCNALKMGTESVGGFRNITITNCVISSPPPSAKLIGGDPRGLAGIALEIVDGGTLQGVTVSNVTIDGVTTPIFLRLGNRARAMAEDLPKPGVGAFRNVLLNNIIATRAGRIACSITGVPGHHIENVCLSNIQITCEGGGTTDEAAKAVPECEAHYPECRMFGGVLPAYGFYCRHVVGLKFRDVQLRTGQPDLRHVIVCDDVRDLVLDGVDASPAAGAAAAVRLINSHGAVVRNCGDMSVERHEAN